MSPISKELSQELDKPRGQYAQDLKRSFREIRRAFDIFLNEPEQESLEAILGRVTELAASSASLGFADVSAVAMTLELKLAACLGRGGMPGEDEYRSFRHLLASLEHTIESQQRAGPSFIIRSLAKIEPRPLKQRVEEVLVVSEDARHASWLASQVASFGYPARHAATVKDAAALLASIRPAALVLDCVMLKSCLDLVSTPQAQGDEYHGAPLLVVTGPDELNERLAAARAGATAYFTRPVNVAALVDKLDTLLSSAMSEPYRIMIVDDDRTLSRVYELVFQEKGWVTYVVNDPMQLLEPLTDFNPDIIPMDLYMPGVDGTEMAAVLRQFEKYVSIPIVYLSMEEDVSKQLSAVSLGADDFLSKTMRPDHLVAAIQSRVRRYRVLRSMLTRDSLTNLLNHTSLKIRLESECSRARRIGARLAFAMIDLDHFKNVNDTYGHLVGDKVLKILAKVLKQRLRVSDVVGRYGGEEFAVILLDIDDRDHAAELLDRIRAAFADMDQSADGATFRVTFSCGIATFPEFTDAHTLADAADRALYEGKRLGRNRVVLASADKE
ncbi:MAG: diguanylate cyclase [Desulfocurvibacter africanus]